MAIKKVRRPVVYKSESTKNDEDTSAPQTHDVQQKNNWMYLR
jgi:hypothetical protein